MEVYHEEYDDQRMEEMKEKYPTYEDMDVEDLDSELPYLDKDLRESETIEESRDIEEEIAYVEQLRRRMISEAYESEDITRERLVENILTYPNYHTMS